MLSVHLHHTLCCALWYPTSCLQEAKFYCKYDSLHGRNLHHKDSIKEEINNIYLYKYKWIGQHYLVPTLAIKQEHKHTNTHTGYICLETRREHGECNFNLLFNNAVTI